MRAALRRPPAAASTDNKQPKPSPRHENQNIVDNNNAVKKRKLNHISTASDMLLATEKMPMPSFVTSAEFSSRTKAHDIATPNIVTPQSSSFAQKLKMSDKLYTKVLNSTAKVAPYNVFGESLSKAEYNAKMFRNFRKTSSA